jgi:hypothetical protein
MIVLAGAPRLATLIGTGRLLAACGDLGPLAWSAAAPSAAGRDRDAAQSDDAVLPRCDIASATTSPLPDDVRETSGLAPSRRQPQFIWTYNDSGNIGGFGARCPRATAPNRVERFTWDHGPRVVSSAIG